MPTQLTPAQICALAHTICDAASPPPPVVDPEASVETQEQQALEWFYERGEYKDARILILISSAMDPAHGKEGWEILIGEPVAPCESDEWENFFLAYELYDVGQDPETADALITVEAWRPGPWMDHLITVAGRADTVLRERSGDT